MSSRSLLALILLLWCAFAYRGLPTHPWSYDDYDHIEKARQVLVSPSVLWASDSEVDPTARRARSEKIGYAIRD